MYKTHAAWHHAGNAGSSMAGWHLILQHNSGSAAGPLQGSWPRKEILRNFPYWAATWPRFQRALNFRVQRQMCCPGFNPTQPHAGLLVQPQPKKAQGHRPPTSYLKGMLCPEALLIRYLKILVPNTMSVVVWMRGY